MWMLKYRENRELGEERISINYIIDISSITAISVFLPHELERSAMPWAGPMLCHAGGPC